METTCESEAGLDVLNVGSGDIEIRFDNGDQLEVERAKRIITDCLKRGYALFVHEGDELKRVRKFDPAKAVYVVADGPTVAPASMQAEAEPATAPKRRGRPPTREVPMARAKATVVGRSAGG